MIESSTAQLTVKTGLFLILLGTWEDSNNDDDSNTGKGEKGNTC